ncbi:uncharacterized protein SPAPADRAFT_51223 [Spathaspora passalidarum NRRL Y-27907]|uniref:LsmAD domain-containing protein n=1 Tax=Spathaspora passalidarum (strain NRRL Y-27907 / 11-Y1) TaxID=619300 RepID=G3AQW0_SPAPN|nr:uncharacterized protein SPAPADRAFT_51223 [Spathaspora passalidarum NRRL Y-27907]EGW31189.1 hypothetical protein SPAPADRAFT_51223 [Spathaspora passalidarum NRRL Y-27907]
MKGQINRANSTSSSSSTTTTTPKNGYRRTSRYGNGNGSPNITSPTTPPTNASNGTSGDDSLGNNRLLYLVSKSIGKKCIATITDGSRYQGLLVNADLSPTGTSAMSVVLLKPQLVSKSLLNEKNNLDVGKLPENLIIQAKDLIDLEITDLDLTEKVESTTAQQPEPTPVQTVDLTTPPPPPPVVKEVSPSKFKTDVDISGKLQIKERELQRWVPDESIDHPQFSLEDDAGEWDQFKVNQERFGVESTYDEHLYTTRIDTSAPDYHERVARAEQIARDIETSTTTDRHILEERGVMVDDSGMDEEDKYSGVARGGEELMAALRNATISAGPSTLNKSSPGKYVPPRQRAAHYHNDPAIISSSATNRKVVSPPPNSEIPPVSKVETPPVDEKPQSPAQATPVAAASSTKETTTPVPVDTPISRTSTSTSTPDIKKPSPPKKTQPDSIPPKPQVSAQHNESFRLNAQSEINSLREFSANFKIPHKMPQDLLPILSKDKLKQDEILKKQQQVAAAAAVAAATATTTSSIAATPSASQESVSPPEKKKETSKTFKLNPKAAAFTPSTKHAQLTSPPKTNFRSPINDPSPRASQSRPYSSNGSISSQGTSKRHHQISPAEFFGGNDKIPTRESQEKKINAFKFAFSLFITTKDKHEGTGPVVFEKTFQTPPTWDSTIDETHEKLFPQIPPKVATGAPGAPGMILPVASPFIPNPMMAGGAPGIPAGAAGQYPNKFHMTPQQQQQQQQAAAAAAAAAMAVQFQQQQQMHAAMLYQQQHPQAQQQFPVPPPAPGQPPLMYPGAEPFLPPGGFIPPPGAGFMSTGSPVNGNIIMGQYGGANQQQQHNYNNHHHSGGNRRYSGHSKRGGGSTSGASGGSGHS